jgi:hypothetical protein
MCDDLNNEDPFRKFTICVLTPQNGKTFIAVENIKNEIENDIEYGRSLHIVFTMNTLLNNDQFAQRLKPIENKYGKNSICVFSSKYSEQYTHVKNKNELQGMCHNIKTLPKVVIMCSNKKRFNDGIEFIKCIDDNRLHIKRVFVYYDELHEYISMNKLRGQIEEINNFEIVKKILALTATPNKLWIKDHKFWGEFPLIYLNNLNDSDYIGHDDMVFKPVDDFEYKPSLNRFQLSKHTIEFIKYVLDKNPEILADNTRSFIPAHYDCKSHIAVRDLIFSKNENAVVILINGKEKGIEYKINGKKYKIPLSLDEELSKTISNIIIQNKLQDRPVVITGHICISMGQTLTHETTGSFTSAIFGHLDLKNDEIYQLFGRTAGRMRKWNTYIKTTIYCPTTIKERCKGMEIFAKQLAKDYNGENVTQENYIDPITKMGETSRSIVDNFHEEKQNKSKSNKPKRSEDDKSDAIFETQEDAIAYAATYLNVKFVKRSHGVLPNELLQDGNLPTRDYLNKRMWGLSKKNPARMVPTKDGKWCVYWRPSLKKTQTN